VTSSFSRSLPWLVVGAGMSHLCGWVPNVAAAMWLVPLFLLRFSRTVPRAWQVPVAMFPALTAVGMATVRGAWHMDLAMELFFAAVLALPLVIAASVDRILSPRLAPLPRTLVFPAVWVGVHWIYSHLYGVGDVFSPALTQFHVTPLLQLVSLTGIYGITFLIGWFASVGATVWDAPDDLRAWRAPVAALGLALAAVLLFGSARIAGLDHDTPTVRIASVVVPHERDYWAAIVDRGTPSAEADEHRAELADLERTLFEETRRAARAGAQIVFWSEAAAVMYEDDAAAFGQRARALAEELGIYLQTASLTMFFDDERLDNRITLVEPDGDVAYTYLKTQTWYPTESDGVIHSVQTPFGRLSSVICFDLDVPGWMRQVATMDVDILLVPGFDTRAISPYHTEAGLYRAVEGGYSIVRGVADGTSMAVDPTGRTLALQDSFRTAEPVLYVDVPIRGRTTLYGLVGDWVVALSVLGLLALVTLAVRSR